MEKYNSWLVRHCDPTDYALSNGIRERNGHCWWWLRTPGEDQRKATAVTVTGSIIDVQVNMSFYAVRPAMWIDLDA